MGVLIGITGGIGSGKSTIAHCLEQRGFPVFYSDAEAKAIIEQDDSVRRSVIALFGEEVYEGNRYRKDKVAQLVFSQPDLLLSLNKIVHPAVQTLLQKRVALSSILFVESAILIESRLNLLCDHVVAISAPESVRLERTMLRDGTSRQQVLSRMRAQSTDAYRAQSSDLILTNDGAVAVDQLAATILSTYHLSSTMPKSL